MIKHLSLFMILLVYSSCKNLNQTDANIDLNNRLLKGEIISQFNKIKKATHNDYYVQKADTINSVFEKAISLVQNDKLYEACSLIEDLNDREGFNSKSIKELKPIIDSKQLNKELIINRLLIIQNALIAQLYSMNVESNFEFDLIKLIPLEKRNLKVDDVYKADLILAGFSSEKKYKVVIDKDTLKEYNGHFPMFEVKAAKKGVNKVKATVIVEQWGKVSKFFLEFDYKKE